MIQSKAEKTFYIINNIFLLICAVVAVYPLLYVLSASLSDPTSVAMGNIRLFPKGLNLNSYKEVINYNDGAIWVAYANTFYYVIVGTAVSLLLTIFTAYPLSKKRLRGGTIITFLVAFTMWFNAGMIPTYLNYRDFHLVDTRTSILLHGAIVSFYVFMMKTFFQSIPDSLEEAAKIDGAGDIYIMLHIYLPLSASCIITIMLYYLVSRWNAYLWSSILLNTESKIPLQVLLKKLVVDANWNAETAGIDSVKDYNAETLVYATMVVSIVPMLILYPFLQKYFIKGVMIGAVKG